MSDILQRRSSPPPRGGWSLGELDTADILNWFWAWPELIDWPFRVSWLFSFAQGSLGHSGPPGPGELWGIDTEGELLLVSLRIGGTKRRVDPFAPFVSGRNPSRGKLFHDDRTRTRRGTVLHADWLRSQWRDSLAREVSRIDHNRPGDEDAMAGELCLLPHGRRGAALRRWIGARLYDPLPLLTTSDYVANVMAALKRRAATRQPKHHYVGILVGTAGEAVRFNTAGRDNYTRLYVESRPSYVHVRTLDVRRRNKQLEIACGMPSMLDLLAGLRGEARVRAGERADHAHRRGVAHA